MNIRLFRLTKTGPDEDYHIHYHSYYGDGDLYYNHHHHQGALGKGLCYCL